MNIEQNVYLRKIHDSSINQSKCATDPDIKSDLSSIILDLGENIIDKKNIEYTGTFVLEKFLYMQAEFNNMPFDTITLQKPE